MDKKKFIFLLLVLPVLLAVSVIITSLLVHSSSVEASSNVTVQITPIADTYADSANPSTNYGNAAILYSDGSPIKIAFLKFDLTSLANKTISAATLNLNVNNATVSTENVKSITDSSWSENTLTYNLLPSGSTLITTFKGAASGTWIRPDVTSAVAANVGQLLTLSLDSTGGDGLGFYSRESTSNKPYLQITYSDQSGPTATPVPVATVSPTIGPSPTQIPVPSTPTPTQILIQSPTPSPTLTPSLTPLPLPTVDITPTPLPNSNVVIVAAGDIVPNSTCTSTSCPAYSTSNTILNQINPQGVLELGDLQYNGASQTEMTTYYDPSWGRLNSLSYPSVGNHDANGYYYTYFKTKGNQLVAQSPAVDKSKSYYSFDIGTWHIISLNSNCSTPATVDCTTISAQLTWLKDDLAAHQNTCTLAYWHHPLFSTGHDGNNSSVTGPVKNFWDVLYKKNVDVVLNGHSHDYERFNPQDPAGNSDPSKGIQEFVVGTGGAFFTGWWTSTPVKNSAIRNNATHGILKLTLYPTKYDWQFIPNPNESSLFTDSGTGTCH